MSEPGNGSNMQQASLVVYLLRLADNNLVLAQRLCEWVGKGPVLEEDIASTNVGLDLLGQARLWYAYAGEVERALTGSGRTEDQFAFLRDAHEFRNLLICEQPNGNYADTIARQFLFDQWHALLLQELASSRDGRIAEIAAKAAKEVAYHHERSSDWVIRLGDGTEVSHQRMQAAIDDLWSYAGEMFLVDPAEQMLVDAGIAADVSALREPWERRVRTILDEATLALPADPFVRKGGKQGVHSEHLGHLVAQMQFLQRAYPGAQW